MTPLSHREAQFLKGYIRDALQLFWCYGYAVSVEDDFGKLAYRFRAHDSMLNATFDPAGDAPFDDGFWLNITDSGGETVGTLGNVVFRNVDFTELLESGHLWSRNGDRGRTEGLWEGPSQPIVGDIGYGGCMWVRPDYRGRGLVRPTHSLSRALAVWRLGIDYQVGIVAKAGLERGLADAYGYPRAENCVNGFFPPARGEVEMYAMWFTRAELLQDLAERDLSPADLRSAVLVKRDAEHVGRDRQHLEQIAAAV